MGTLMTFLRVPWDYTMRTTDFSRGQIGPLYLSFLPLALVKRRPRSLSAVAMVVFALLFTLAWNWTYPLTRILFPVLALASIPTALGAMSLAHQSRIGKGLVILVVTFWLATGLAANLRFHARAIPVALGLTSDAEFLGNYFSAPEQSYTEYPVWAYLNEHLPPDATVLIWDRRGLYLERNYVWAWSMPRGLVSPQSLDSPQFMRDELKRLGVTHVAFHDPAPDDPTASLRPIIEATGCLQPYYQFGSTEVYEVDYTRCSP